jgi:ATP-binding cassette subfamily B protein
MTARTTGGAWRAGVASLGKALYALPARLRFFGRSLALVAAGGPRTTALFVGVTALASILPVIQVWLGKVVVDGLAHLAAVRGVGSSLSSGPGASALSRAAAPAMTAVLVPAALYACIVAVSSALAPAALALSRWLQDRAAAEIDRRMMLAGERLADLGRIERPAFQDEWKELRFAERVPMGLLTVVQNGAGTLLTLAGLLLVLARLHPLLPLALAALGAPYAIGSLRGELKALSTMTFLSRTAREMEYYARLTTEPAPAKEVRIFGLGDFFLQRFRDRFAAASRELAGVRSRALGLQIILIGPYILGVAGGFWYVGAQVGAGRLTLGDLALYLGAIGQTWDRIRSFSQALHFMALASFNLELYFPFVDGARPSIALPPAGHGRLVPSRLRTGIQFDHLSFRYPESSEPVLEDVVGTLPAGRVTALVGANGAGTSTLVKLLTRMYDPSTPPDSTQPPGRILLDGVPLREYDLRSLRARISVVYQDFARFTLTFRENIAVGAVAAVAEAGAAGDDEPGQDGRMERAARWAGADAVAAGLPRGYDTELTRRFEGGVDLSGGEWQKVALARGAIRDAALVILDEPTAALDAEAEYQLFERFRELVAGKTALLISHRFSTVRMVDHILVLEGGRILESGSHDALVALGGRYAALYEMQAGRYR